MATMYLENQQMAEDFVRGCTFMGHRRRRPACKRTAVPDE